MKALIIGYGSIGQRHAQVLRKIGLEVAVVSHRSDISHIKSFKSISAALREYLPSYIVIANQTAKHYSSLLELIKLGFKSKVLVEKPLFDKYKKIPPNKFKEVYVGYNLRFHPIIHKLIDILVKEAIISCSVYVGKYLPFWRPKTDYKKSYSAKKNLGGGVLRDLSHELDYLNLLLGGFRRVTAIGGHFSNLNIETDDVFSLLAETKKCPVVNLEMNYVDRLGRRQILINTDRHTYKADFFNNELYVDEKLLKKFSLSRNYTYERQHKAVLGSSNKEKKLLCSLTKGLEVMRLIVALEAAAKKSKWIKL